MRPLGDETRHHWLARRMARAAGADLGHASDLGFLDQQTWASMVHACRGCPQPQACVRWLSRHSEGVSEPPPFCPNGPAFAALAAAERDIAE